MKALVFDIETVDVFDQVNKKKPEDLEISVVGVYSYPNASYKTYTKDEFSDLWKHIDEEINTLIGFNSNHFDIPLLNKYAPMDLTKTMASIDLLASIKDSIGRRVRLDWVAEGTLGVKKSGEGLDAVKWWRAGEYEKVKKYCLRDVEITKNLFEYAKKHKALKYRDLGTEHTVPVDTSRWDQQPVRIEDNTIRLF